MPFVQISLFRGRSEEVKLALLEGVRDVVAARANVAPEEVAVWLNEFGAEDVMVDGESGTQMIVRKAAGGA